MQKVEKQLRQGLDSLAIHYSDKEVQHCLFLLDQLLLWNKKINLTAIKTANEVVTKHLLDSLALLSTVQDYVKTSGSDTVTILDVGTGAGFPTLPLAIFTSDINYFALDSNSKKLSFIRRVATQLELSNVETIHSRIQELNPDKPYSVITARAFADVNDLLAWLPAECSDEATQVLAMKGKLPEEELSKLEQGLLSSQWNLREIIDLEVPGLEAERCVLCLTKVKSEI